MVTFGIQKTNILDKENQAIFTRIYDDEMWVDDKGTALSGNGSNLKATEKGREILEEVILKYNIKSLCDLSCGDMTWMPSLLKKLEDKGHEIKYIGCDIVEKLILQHRETFKDKKNMEFIVLDMINSKIPKVDLLFSRDTIQHITIEDGIKSLKNISKSGSKYLLTTTYPYQSRSINHVDLEKPGYCISRNLMDYPYHLADPLVLYSEGNKEYHKYLALFELPLDMLRKFNQRN